MPQYATAADMEDDALLMLQRFVGDGAEELQARIESRLDLPTARWIPSATPAGLAEIAIPADTDLDHENTEPIPEDDGYTTLPTTDVDGNVSNPGVPTIGWDVEPVNKYPHPQNPNAYEPAGTPTLLYTDPSWRGIFKRLARLQPSPPLEPVQWNEWRGFTLRFSDPSQGEMGHSIRLTSEQGPPLDPYWIWRVEVRIREVLANGGTNPTIRDRTAWVQEKTYRNADGTWQSWVRSDSSSAPGADAKGFIITYEGLLNPSD